MSRRAAIPLTLALIAVLSTAMVRSMSRPTGDRTMEAGSASVAPIPVPSSERLESVRARCETRVRRELARGGFRYGAPVFLRIFKEESRLELWVGKDADDGRFRLFRAYHVANWGDGALGPKLREGDGQAPEGFYFVAPEQMNPRSRYHLAFNLGYPNPFDRHHGRTGSYLMVHGGDGSVGCYAVTDEVMEEIYLIADAALRQGQAAIAVHCLPFRLTPNRLARARRSPDELGFVAFWENLREGSELFDVNGRPPEVDVDPATGRYAFRGLLP